MTPLQAALTAGRELGGPIIAMTIVLIAVYVPIGFQGGLTGALFTEFAFTLAGAVTVSAIIALTLTPMCCAFILKPPNTDKPTLDDRIVAFIDTRMDRLRHRYQRALASSLNTIPVTVVFAALVLASIYGLYSNSKNELAPEEDQGIILTQSTLAPNATLQQKLLYSAAVYKRFAAHPETAGVFQLDIVGSSIAGWVLKPWDKRDKGAAELQPVIQQEMAGVAGAKIVAFQQPPLPGSSGLPIQFVIQTTDPFDRLDGIATTFTTEALKSGKFIFLDNDLKIDPAANLRDDRSGRRLLSSDSN